MTTRERGPDYVSRTGFPVHYLVAHPDLGLPKLLGDSVIEARIRRRSF